MPRLLTRVAILAAALNTQASSTTAASTGASTNNEGASDGTGFIAIEDDPLIVDTSAIMDSDGMGKGSNGKFRKTATAG
jgi:hypothetical protein